MPSTNWSWAARKTTIEGMMEISEVARTRFQEKPASESIDSFTFDTNSPIPKLDLNRITSQNGNIELTLEQGRRLYVDNGKMVTIPLPGTLEYDSLSYNSQTQKTTTVELINEYALTGLDVLAYYEISRDAITGIGTYLLPNGTQLYLDEDGNVVRIEESGTASPFGAGMRMSSTSLIELRRSGSFWSFTS